jgi:hypothetical protein
MKSYKMMAVPTLLYGSETWILNQNYYSSVTDTEMASLLSVKGCTRLDCFRNEDIRKESNIIPVTENSYRK